MFKKILCVGVFGNENTYILLALIEKFISENPQWRDIFYITPVGIRAESTRGYSPAHYSSFHKVMNQLGFLPSNDPHHPKIMRDAKEKNLIPILWRPTSIQRLENITSFNIFITPYQNVFEELKKRRCTEGKITLLACDFNEDGTGGIDLNCSPEDAAEKMMPWVKNCKKLF